GAAGEGPTGPREHQRTGGRTSSARQVAQSRHQLLQHRGGHRIAAVRPMERQRDHPPAPLDEQGVLLRCRCRLEEVHPQGLSILNSSLRPDTPTLWKTRLAEFMTVCCVRHSSWAISSLGRRRSKRPEISSSRPLSFHVRHTPMSRAGCGVSSVPRCQKLRPLSTSCSPLTMDSGGHDSCTNPAAPPLMHSTTLRGALSLL